MAIKTYGKIDLDVELNQWVITEAQPHVCLKIKDIFQGIGKSETVFRFFNTPEACTDLLWFMDRYPLSISELSQTVLRAGKTEYYEVAAELEKILVPDYVPQQVQLNDGYEARKYQLQVKDFDSKQSRYFLGDDLGLGKTLSAILTLMNPGKLPAIVVVQTHLPKQWMIEGVQKFTNLSVHIIQKRRPYDLPKADVYIIKYSCLSGWSNFYQTRFFKTAIFDEIQELRRDSSDKYEAASVLSDSVPHCMGMSATPIYNYGDEIFNILNIIKPGCLGEKWSFLREWAVPHGMHYKIKDPIALGTYLRDNYLFLRRTRKDVQRELPQINTIVYTVGYDEKEVKRSEDLAQQLALKVVSGSFVERGQAARELDAMVRHQTGVSKAREVAAFVRILLENNEPVVLAGWHRDVYGIWEAELWDFDPVFYTGTESPKQKEDAKAKFISGQTNLFIISLRSGIGLDGLQHRCKTVVIGELDWSPKVHDQVVGRVDRDGQQGQVTVYYPVSEYGSDPVIIELLGLKSSQAHGIVDPLSAVPDQYTDESRIKKLAEYFLNKNKKGGTLF